MEKASKEFFLEKIKAGTKMSVEYEGDLDGNYIFLLYEDEDEDGIYDGGAPIYAVCNPYDKKGYKCVQSPEIYSRLYHKYKK